MLKCIPFGTRFLKRFFTYSSPSLHRRVMGLDFPNPVGLAAGLDKDAKYTTNWERWGLALSKLDL